MVQLQNASRLTQIISFGTTEDAYNVDGTPVPTFKPKFRTLGGRWSLSTAQMIQLAGLSKTQTDIYVVRHRRNWNGIKNAQINGVMYDITAINQDPYQNPTAYDLITLQKVGEDDG